MPGVRKEGKKERKKELDEMSINIQFSWMWNIFQPFDSIFSQREREREASKWFRSDSRDYISDRARQIVQYNI